MTASHYLTTPVIYAYSP